MFVVEQAGAGSIFPMGWLRLVGSDPGCIDVPFEVTEITVLP